MKESAELPTGPALLEDERFIWGHVWPLLAQLDDRPPQGSVFGLRMERGRGTRRRAVAEYTFVGPIRIIAKLYPDVTEGRTAYEVLQRLWRQGFGPDSPYRVTEPIAYLPEHRVLVMRGAFGDALPMHEARGREALRNGLRRAARWLGVLHSSPLQLGRREDVLYGAFRLTRRVTEAALVRPDLEGVLRRATEKLAARGEAVGGPRTRVPTHGRYHPKHVFLAPQCVTVVNLDRAALADPMKDVGEFIHRIRWDGARAGQSSEALEESAESFLSEYAWCSPAGLSSLAYHWSYSVLWTMLGVACSRRIDGPAWEEQSDFLTAEFEQVPGRAAACVAIHRDSKDRTGSTEGPSSPG